MNANTVHSFIYAYMAIIRKAFEHKYNLFVVETGLIRRPNSVPIHITIHSGNFSAPKMHIQAIVLTRKYNAYVYTCIYK